MTRVEGDRGDIVLGWLTRLTVVLAVLGTLSFDGISLVVARFTAADLAADASAAAAASWRATPDVQRAYDAALVTVGPGDRIDPASFSVGTDGAVTLSVTTEAATLVLEKVGPLRRFAEATETATSRPPA